MNHKPQKRSHDLAKLEVLELDAKGLAAVVGGDLESIGCGNTLCGCA